jgi:hypothetical protein
MNQNDDDDDDDDDCFKKKRSNCNPAKIQKIKIQNSCFQRDALVDPNVQL